MTTSETARQIPLRRPAAVLDEDDGTPTEARAPSAGSRTAMTPAVAMHLDEARRALVFALFVIALCAGALPATLVIGGDPRYRAIHQGGMAVAVIAGAWFAHHARDPRYYRPIHQTVFGHACVIAISTGLLYWGVFSAALLMIPVGAFIFSTGQSLRSAASITGHAMVQQLVLASLTIGGVLPDRGLIRPIGLSDVGAIALIALIQFIFVGTFVIARRTRRSTYDAVVQLDGAVRAVAQRDALLAEAEAELRAVKDAGGRGRFTEQTVGRYRLGLLLGRGAMGEVYEATSAAGTCAIKLLHPHLRADPGAYLRFQREAQMAASLDVAHVVRVLEVSSPDDPIPFLAMERLRGEDLADRLKRTPVLPLAAVVTLLREVGAGLAAAHAAGIVHRDLKPGNLFAAEGVAGEVWKILDFGVSKLEASGSTLTQGHVIGTPAYMSPEQARGADVGPRSDLYSLGVIAYRALTGRPVVTAGEVPAMLYDVVYRLPPRPSGLVAVPPQVDLVLALALAKDPRHRVGSGAELGELLAAAGAGRLPASVVARAEQLLAQSGWGSERRARDTGLG